MRKGEELFEPIIDKKYGHTLVQPSYSYWTVAYALSLNGNTKP